MVHKLAIVAVIGLTASAVCMGAAAAIGGKEFGENFDGFLHVRRPSALRNRAGRHRHQPRPGLGRQRPCRPVGRRPCPLHAGQRRQGAC